EVFEVNGFSVDKPSAKTARQVLSGCKVQDGSVLVLTAEHDDNIYRSFRNFPRVSVMAGADANAYELLAHKYVIAQEGAIDAMVARF
ncbi:MAG: 50S ribosomal protein L4, partial [Planctomycetota bacterium]|nr:50S ribosomal protein L4 [Planctomycetota bacterium]